MDANGDGRIGFEEFVVFMSTIKNPTMEDQIKSKYSETIEMYPFLTVAFAIYDENSDGKLSLR